MYLLQNSSGALSMTSFMTKKVRVWRTPGRAIKLLAVEAPEIGDIAYPAL